jgi:hypothetical protein
LRPVGCQKQDEARYRTLCERIHAGRQERAIPLDSYIPYIKEPCSNDARRLA